MCCIAILKVPFISHKILPWTHLPVTIVITSQFACNHDLLFCKDDDAIFSEFFFSPVSTAIKPWIVCLYLLVSMQHEGNDFAILLSENPKCSLWPTNYVLISQIYLGKLCYWCHWSHRGCWGHWSIPGHGWYLKK